MMTWDSVFSTKRSFPKDIEVYASRNAAIMAEVAHHRSTDVKGSLPRYCL